MDGTSSFLKQLASSDRRTRDKAVETLRSYIQHRNSIDQDELLKLWKGLFFCMWHSDKPRTQQQLARDLAGLVDVVPKEVVVPFLRAFWVTMAREWMGIDVLRMDKYLYLIRLYVRSAWTRLSKNDWADTDLLDKYLDLLGEIPLNPTELKIPNGMRYHVVDVYVDELAGIGLDQGNHDLILKLLTPLDVLEKESHTKTVRLRVKEAKEDPRLEEWLGKTSKREVTGDGEEDEWSGIGD